MRKNTIIMGMALFFILTLFSLSFGAEELTITTYYPSPYGSYKELEVSDELTLKGMLSWVDVNPVISTAWDTMDIFMDTDDNVVAGDIFRIWHNGSDTGSATNVFTIDNSGNVGIGTANPGVKLQVNGWTRIGTGETDSIQFETQDTFHRVAFNNLRFWDWNVGVDMVTFDDGNVGIGVANPEAKLDVAGTIRARDVFGEGGQNIIVGDDAYLTDIDTPNLLGIYGLQDSSIGGIRLGSGWPWAYICGMGGNIGIGRCWGQAKLDIEGDLRVRGTINTDTSPCTKNVVSFTAGALLDAYVDAPSGTHLVSCSIFPVSDPNHFHGMGCYPELDNNRCHCKAVHYEMGDGTVEINAVGCF